MNFIGQKKIIPRHFVPTPQPPAPPVPLLLKENAHKDKST